VNENTQKELVRVVELDYEKTTKQIESIVGSSFTIRGWGIALISALIGLTLQANHWGIAVLAVVVTLLIAFVDGYHSWLYAKVLQHANRIEPSCDITTRFLHAVMLTSKHESTS
jgi:hypothetical protein